jgi:hypothetical protein
LAPKSFEPESENTLLIICQTENSDLQLIILRWSILKLEYSMIPKIYFTKFLSKNTANRCKII